MRAAGVSRRVVLRGLAGYGAVALAATGQNVQGEAQETTPAASPAVAAEAVAVVVLYGLPADPAAFEAYYLGTHQPLAFQIPHVQRLEAARTVDTLDGAPVPFHRIAELHFATRTDLEAALASAEGRAVFADLTNFATGGATAFVVTDLQAAPGRDANATPPSSAGATSDEEADRA